MPAVSQDVYSCTPVKKESDFKSREERLNLAKNHFAKTYEEETGKKPETLSGIVNVSFHEYPYGMNILINPDFDSFGVTKTIGLKRTVRTPYIYGSHSFLMKNGKLKELVDDNSVLNAQACKDAVERLRRYYQWLSVENLGTVLIDSKRWPIPCRLWRVWSLGGVRYLAFSLINGMVLYVPSIKMPGYTEAPEKFRYNDISFHKGPGAGDYERL